MLETLESRYLLAADVVISEFMASNTETLQNSQRQYLDWIELHNRGVEDVNLEGWVLRDRATEFYMPDVAIGADEYLVVFASGTGAVQPEPFEISTNFRLAKDGEYLALIAPDGNVTTEFNPFPAQDDDISYGLSHGDVFPQYFDVATPGEQNPDAPHVIITEFMAVNQSTIQDEDGDFADWIELYNAGDAHANLNGWKLEDSSVDWEFGEVMIPPREYLVVFASGNDQRDPDGELHTNFKLGGDGDSLFLVRPDGIFASAYPRYPIQSADVSYGIPLDRSEEQYFNVPTPGRDNVTGVDGVRFSHKSNFYNDPFLLTLSSENSDAVVRYTTDGSLPTEDNGNVYSASISISTSTVVRAASFVPDELPVHTSRSYLLLDPIGRQNGNGLPQTWGAVSDYDMDPQVVGRDFNLHELRNVPAVSIGVKPDDLFSIRDGIFAHPLMEGPEWKRPVSVDVFSSTDRYDISTSGMIETTGAVGERNPAVTSKFSMEITFDQPLHQPQASWNSFLHSNRRFGGIVLRAGHADSWLAAKTEDRDAATYSRDAFILQTQRDMGQPSLNHQPVNVFLNGLYWGLYTVTEQPSADTFAEQTGGLAPNFDVIGDTGVISGNGNSWSKLLQLANEDLSQPEAYAAVDNLIDLDNLIDFILLKRYAKIEDSAVNSWIAGRDRTGSPGFQFLMYSNEQSLGISGDPDPNGEAFYAPEYLFSQLTQNSQFRRRFADRAQMQLDTGPLSLDWSLRRWQTTVYQNQAVRAESARWGDYRRDANPRGGNATLYGESHRFAAKQNVIDEFITTRSSELLAELRNQNLMSQVEPPSFPNQFSGQAGSIFEISTPSGEIYYTTDGSDPINPDDTISETALRYTTPVRVNETHLIRARSIDGGKWSAIVERLVRVHRTSPLRITEIMYHPAMSEPNSPFDDDAFEFIELQNHGDETLSLSGMRFTQGISFDFSQSEIQSLEPGQIILVIKNREAFESRYDAEGLLIAGEFDGQLNNGGDYVRIEGDFGDEVVSMSYSDLTSKLADGLGFSLELEYDPYTQFKTSAVVDGTPGFLADSLDIGSVVVSEVLTTGTHPQGDWIELHNTTDMPIDISGWYLSDSPEQLRKFSIPHGTILGPDQYVVFSQLDQFGNADHPNTRSEFSLSADGETIFLSSIDDQGRLGGYREQSSFGAAQSNVSMGRIDKLDGTADYVPLETPTRGSKNTKPRVGPVVINEVLHSPVRRRNPQHAPVRENIGEFIEIHNISNQPIPLYDVWHPSETWRFTEGISFEFPENQILPARGYALIVGMDPEIFRQRAGINPDISIYGAFDGVLRNEGEAIALAQATSENADDDTRFTVVDRVDYNDTTPWPALANDGGSSIERRDADEYANDPANWMPSLFGGSPGSPNIGVNETPRSIPFEEDFDVESLDQLTGWQFTSAVNGEWTLQANDSIAVEITDSCNFCDASERLSDATLGIEIENDNPLAVVFTGHNLPNGVDVQISEDGRKWDTVFRLNGSAADVGFNLSDELVQRGIEIVGTRYVRFSSNYLTINDVSVFEGDVVGPSVVDHEFIVGDSLEAISITFNEPIERFDERDIQVVDPIGGRIPPVDVSTDDNITWTIKLPNQAVAGRYRFDILSSVEDSNGNSLTTFNYSENGRDPADGKYSDSIYIQSQTSETFPYTVDFEDTSFDDLTSWEFETFPGIHWEIDPADGPGNRELTSTGSAAFSVSLDLTDQANSDDLALDFRARTWDGFGSLSILAASGDSPPRFISSASTSRQSQHYAIDLDKAIRKVGLDFSEPITLQIWAHRPIVIDDFRISDVDVFGPSVTTPPVGGIFDAPIASFQVSFDEPMDVASVRDGIEVFNSVGQRFPVESVSTDDSQSFTLHFAPQVLAGRYAYIVRESVTDLNGNPMNQFANNVGGEPADSFMGSFTVSNRPVATFPYRQSFDTLGELDGWSFSVPGVGQWQIGENNGFPSGNALTTIGNGRSSHEAILAMDLSARADGDISMSFAARSQFGRALGRLSLSGDGESWRFASDIQLQDRYVVHSFDLKHEMSSRGIDLDDEVYIRFDVLHAGNGVSIDEVFISDRPAIGARIVEQLPLELTDEEAIVSVTFDQEIDADSFDISDVWLQLIGSRIAPGHIATSDLRTFNLTFPRPASAGLYELVIGPGILNQSGIPMNQTEDPFNGMENDLYSGAVFVPLDPQPIPYIQEFVAEQITSYEGWIFQTVNEAGNFAGGDWDITNEFDPFGDHHLSATQFSDCWSQHDGILAVDYADVVDATDMVLEFSMRRTTTNARKSRDGERNLGQLLIGDGFGEFTQVGGPDTLLSQSPVSRFADLNQDGIIDLVPEFDQYVFYRFDLDKLIEQAGLHVEDALYINFHRLAFFNTDVTLFDNVRVYRESETIVPPSVIGVELFRIGNPDLNVVHGASIMFDKPVNGFTLSDLSLTRNGGPNLLDNSAVFVSPSPETFLIDGLFAIVDLPGEYQLSLNAQESGIVGELGEPLAEGFSRTWIDSRQPGDANLDGVFNSSDLVQVFTYGEYEDEVIGNSSWESGDWNGDGDFGTGDLVAAFTTGNYSPDNAVAHQLIVDDLAARKVPNKIEAIHEAVEDRLNKAKVLAAVPKRMEIVARDALFQMWSFERRPTRDVSNRLSLEIG